MNNVESVKLSTDEQFIAKSLTLLSSFVACLTIVFDIFILCCLISSDRMKNYSSRSKTRRIGFLHSINTYIHLAGNTLALLFMSLRTVSADIVSIVHTTTLKATWHCHLLHYITILFTAGSFASCLCQSLFRFWRITQPNRSLFRQYRFHRRLLITQWILVVLVSIPIGLRSVYISSANVCFNHYNDTWPSFYFISLCIILPIVTSMIVYVRVIVYVRTYHRKRASLKYVRRHMPMIRRIIILIVVQILTACVILLVWPCDFIFTHVRSWTYPLFNFVMTCNLLIYSLVFIIVSPQLRRIMQCKDCIQAEHDCHRNITHISIRSITGQQLQTRGIEFSF
jgi:hypothetical protein